MFELQLERLVIVAVKLILALVCGGVLGIETCVKLISEVYRGEV